MIPLTPLNRGHPIQRANERIQEALLLPENEVDEQVDSKTLKFENYSTGYKSCSALEGLNFEIKKGELLGVIGPVGSGKTTLLNCLIGETVSIKGTKLQPQSISITTQEAWIFGGSIKANVLMNLPFDEKRYKEIVQATCLTADFELLPNGDETIVGEKGVTLSGGQKV